MNKDQTDALISTLFQQLDAAHETINTLQTKVSGLTPKPVDSSAMSTPIYDELCNKYLAPETRTTVQNITVNIAPSNPDDIYGLVRKIKEAQSFQKTRSLF